MDVDYDLFIVGSTQTKFALKSSDLDLCFVIYSKGGDIDTDYVQNRRMVIDKLTFIEAIVKFSPDGLSRPFSNVELIPHAIVPILKFNDNSKNETISVDINVNRIVTIRNTFLLACYKYCRAYHRFCRPLTAISVDCSQCDHRVAPLVVAVKSWARKNNINSSFLNTLSSYNLTLMVIHFLQNCRPPVLPRLQALCPPNFFQQIYTPETMDSYLRQCHEYVSSKFKCQNQSSIGKLFADFICYFSDSSIFDNKISINEPLTRYYRHHNSSYIMIEDPFEEKNTAYSVYLFYRFMDIQRAFITSQNALKNGTFSKDNFEFCDI